MRPIILTAMLLLLLAHGSATVAKEEIIPTDPTRRRQDQPPNPLRDVSQEMGTAARRLKDEKTGDETQDIQKGILGKLDTLVDQAQKQQQQQQQPPQSNRNDPKNQPQQQKQQPKPDPKAAQDEKEKQEKQKQDKQPQPAKKEQQQESQRPGIGPAGQGRGTGALHTDAEEWGALPPAIREQLLQTRGEGFPLKYRELLRRYYRELARPREEK